MARMPLIVQVACDTPDCTEGLVFHGRGAEITIDWLVKNLAQHGWTQAVDKATGLELDLCDMCSKHPEQN